MVTSLVLNCNVTIMPNGPSGPVAFLVLYAFIQSSAGPLLVCDVQRVVSGALL